MWLRKITPKTFCCSKPLKLGAYLFGILMAIISIICIICTLAQVFFMNECDDCPGYAFRNAYGYSIIAVVFSVLMLIVTIWYIIGCKKGKYSVVLAWLVISFIWLCLTFGLLIVLICVYSNHTSLVAWLCSLIFGIIAIVILTYGWLVVAGYWLELRRARTRKAPVNLST